MLEDTRPGASFVHGQLEVQLDLHPEARILQGADGRYIRAAQARLARIRPHLRVDNGLPRMSTAPHAEAPALLVAAAAHLSLGHAESAAAAFRHANAIIGQERLLSAYSFLPSSTVEALSRRRLGSRHEAVDLAQRSRGGRQPGE